MRFISPHDCSLPRSQSLGSSLHAKPTASRFSSSRCSIASVNMSESSLEREERLARQQRLYDALELLQHDPASITTEDAQAFADEVPEGDERTATIAAAFQDLAIQNASNKEAILSNEDRTPTTRLSHLVEDLYAAVSANPGDVTAKTRQTTQRILNSKSHAAAVLRALANNSAVMQQAMNRANAPHPELQAELQQEYARIVPKVERTDAENSHPHAFTRQVNGHTQDTGARHRRQISSRSDSSNISPRATRHHEGLRRVSDPESLERLKDGMAKSQAAFALLSLSEQHSPETSAGTSSNSYVDCCRSLDETTNTTPGNEGHHTALPQPDNHAPTNINNGGPEKVPGLRRRKDYHSVP
jgi:hypothetical protein